MFNTTVLATHFQVVPSPLGRGRAKPWRICTSKPRKPQNPSIGADDEKNEEAEPYTPELENLNPQTLKPIQVYLAHKKTPPSPRATICP